MLGRLLICFIFKRGTNWRDWQMTAWCSRDKSQINQSLDPWQRTYWLDQIGIMTQPRPASPIQQQATPFRSSDVGSTRDWRLVNANMYFALLKTWNTPLLMTPINKVSIMKSRTEQIFGTALNYLPKFLMKDKHLEISLVGWVGVCN